MMRKTPFERALPWLVTLGLFVLWEIACAAFRVEEFILPRPSVVWDAFVKARGPILDHSLSTLLTTLAGFAIAVGAGLVLGALVGWSRTVYDALNPILVGFNSIPKVAVVPILVIWCGVGAVPAILTAFLISFFPIMVNVATGLATLEPELRDVLRALGASKLEITRKVGIPRAMPYFFASLKVAVTLAFVGSVTSEIVASNKGIGYLMLAASGKFDVPLVFAGLIVVAAMGVLMYQIFAAIERRTTRWAFRGVEVAG
jgi:NitT/TauT family transport system permease protein